MDRDWLEAQLAAGRSIESIAREVRRDPSTVSYWARKHGLTSTHAARHAARGGIDRELLAEIMACRLSIRDMADVLELSPTTVRQWLGKYGLATSASIRRHAAKVATSNGVRQPDLPCPNHGLTPHVPRGDGTFRCMRCRSEQVAEHRRRKAATRRRSRRRMFAVWLRQMHRSSPVPPSGPMRQELRAERPGRGAIASQSS